jgi:glucokinase
MTPVHVVLGIDIGGTTTSFALVDRDGKCLAQEVIPTRAEEPASHLVSRICDWFREAFPPFSESYALRGIGVGAPNANYYTGTVESPPNLNWGKSVNLAGLFSDCFALPVSITNDANAAAIGEMEFGAAIGMRHFIVITLGTGVGSGIVVDGDLLYGADGFAGEIGHTVVDPQGRRCACGKRGCLEAYASAAGLCRTAITLLADQVEESELRRFSIRDLTARDVFEAARRGDAIALDAFRETGRILGMKLADAVAFTSPEAIFLFGGLAAAGELLFEPTRSSLEEHLLNIYRGKVRLLPSGLRDCNAAVLGAAALIWRELETGGRRRNLDTGNTGDPHGKHGS